MATSATLETQSGGAPPDDIPPIDLAPFPGADGDGNGSEVVAYAEEITRQAAADAERAWSDLQRGGQTIESFIRGQYTQLGGPATRSFLWG